MKPYVLIPLFLMLTACNTLVNTTADLAVSSGFLTEAEAEAFKRANMQVSRTFSDIDPKEQYFLGRAVSANIVSRYRVIPRPKENHYLNLVGQSLVLVSEKPEVYKGYRFMILESEEINAFAAPAGFIFVSKGMLRLCGNEDDLAAVLAHEIAHIQHDHALKAIKTNRFTEAATTVAAEAAKTYGNSQMAELTQQFEGSIADMTQTLVNSGYSRELEDQADKTAIQLLQLAGYDSYGLLRILQRIGNRSPRTGIHDFTATHPAAKDRIAQIMPLLGNSISFLPSRIKNERFRQALQGL